MLALRRINKDLKEITKNPKEGIGIAQLDENPMLYVINIRLMAGPYEGYCVQLLLIFSDNYPTKPPKILIFPDQAISNQYHHHIFDDLSSVDNNGHHYKKFCFDLLDNDFAMNTSGEKTGWNPSYSISSLLLQVQNFISDPDLGNEIPNDYLIQQLMKSMESYTRTFTVTNDKGIKEERIHTWKNPYPEMYFKSKEEEKNKENNKSESKEKKDKENQIQQIKENLTCFMLKVNYLDDPNILLGYPIVRTNIFLGRKIRLELFPIPELLTYDGFLTQKSLQIHMAEMYFDGLRLKSANNEYFNSWLPIYINKDHYEQNKETILKSIAEITNNISFKPEQIFQVLPTILNSMIIGMYKEKSTLSSSFIKCYFQYILLFKKLCQEYDVDYSVYLNNIFSEIKNNNYSVNKNIIPDIGNLFIVLLFNKVEITNDTLKKIYNALFDDFITRQMSWMFHSPETKDKMKTFLLYNKSNETYLESFEKDPNFKMNNLVKFNEDLHTKNIYKDVIDIIGTDKGFLEHILIGKEKAREQVEKRIKQSFKRLFEECSKEGRNKLKDIILKNLNFKDYFGYIKNEDEYLYDSYKVDEILMEIKDEKIKNEFIQMAFESQRGNKLLLITFFAQKKIEEENFLEELEKNYGVYLEVDKFIKEMKDKLSEIKTYKSLFEYIGCDFLKKEGKYKDDLELIIDSYKKAKEKGYFGRRESNLLGNSKSSFQSNLSASNYSINRSNYNNNFRNSRNFNEYHNYNRNYYNYNNNYRRDRNRSRSRSRSHSYERRHHHHH